MTVVNGGDPRSIYCSSSVRFEHPRGLHVPYGRRSVEVVVLVGRFICRKDYSCGDERTCAVLSTVKWRNAANCTPPTLPLPVVGEASKLFDSLNEAKAKRPLGGGCHCSGRTCSLHVNPVVGEFAKVDTVIADDPCSCSTSRKYRNTLCDSSTRHDLQAPRSSWLYASRLKPSFCQNASLCVSEIPTA
jgi:hypothetical protein